MALQGVDNVYDLEWARGVKYGTVRLRDEVEQSKYAFGQVPALPEGRFAEFHRDLFEKNYEFAKALLESGLVLPALDFTLKCSHAFNVLDASGSIGVTERTAYILRVRQLAIGIAKEWVSGASDASAAAESNHPVVSDRRESNHGS
jgi:glycyl-tRNA synthetase alpha chain